MYIVPLKAAIVEALRATFGPVYPEPDFRSVNVGIEYPAKEADYPGLWVNYEDHDQLQVAGIGHKEYLSQPSGNFIEVTRWRFGGSVTITAVALSSLERDRLYDEVVRVMAFARENTAISQFRDKVETNDFIGMNMNFDELQPSGDNASQGTPWGTDEFVYEKSLSIDLIGEFVGDPTSQELGRLSKIVVTEMDPTMPAPQDAAFLDSANPQGNGGWR